MPKTFDQKHQPRRQKQPDLNSKRSKKKAEQSALLAPGESIEAMQQSTGWTEVKRRRNRTQMPPPGLGLQAEGLAAGLDAQEDPLLDENQAPWEYDIPHPLDEA